MQKYNAAIVVPDSYTHFQAFDEIGLGLSSALKELGVHDPNGRNIILGAHLAESLPDDAIIWNLEQIMIGSPWLTQKYVELMRRHTVWDYSYQNIAELKKLGIEAKFLGIGYQPELTKIIPADQDIDVVFAGSLNDRRKKILDELSKHCSVGIATGYGEQRDKVYARAKICICLHYYESKVWELVRCSYLMSNKKCIVSEVGNDRELERPFDQGGIHNQGIAFVAYEDLVEACLNLLKDSETRNKYAEKGFEIFSKIKQSEFLKPLLTSE